MLLCDAHAHLGNDTEWEERTGKGILSLICATGPEEAGKLFYRLEWLKGRAVVPTAGLHPWYADQYTVQDMEPGGWRDRYGQRLVPGAPSGPGAGIQRTAGHGLFP